MEQHEKKLQILSFYPRWVWLSYKKTSHATIHLNESYNLYDG